jgi:hypothetical protein
MKKLLLLIPLVLGVGSSAWAAACTSEALSIYEGSGFSCSVGGLVFSEFSSTGIDTGTTVDPVTGPEAGLDFNVDLTAPSSGAIASVDYEVSCTLCAIDDWELQNGTVTSTSGTVNVLEQSTPGALDQETSEPANTTIGIGAETFSPADPSLMVNTSISLGGGTSSTTLQSFTSLFSSTSTVPEPSSLILCAGLLGLLPFARRRFVR